MTENLTKLFESDAGPYLELGQLADKLYRKIENLHNRAFSCLCQEPPDLVKFNQMTLAAEKMDKELIQVLRALDKRGRFFLDKDLFGLNGEEARQRYIFPL